MAVYKRNNEWWIDYYVNGRRRREKVGTSKTLADNALRKRKVQIAEGKFLDIKKRCLLKFKDFAQEYLELHSKVHNRSWRKSDLSNINMLNQFFGNKFLDEITAADVDKFKSQRLQEVSPARVNRNLTTLKSIFSRAVEWGRIELNTIKGVKKIKEDNCRLRYLEKEEIRRLIEHCCDSLKPIVMTALYTGMRLGEILTLEWKNVDLRRDIIYILKAKNGEKREIPIHEELRKCFESLHQNKISGFVFVKKNGSPYRDIRASFFTALRKSDIVDFRFHDLRHTCASHLVMSGIDIAIVRDILGHKSLAMTQRYAHLSPSYKSKAISYLNFSDGHHMDTREKSVEKDISEDLHKLFEDIKL